MATFHLQYTPEYMSSFVMMTTPFLPQVKRKGAQDGNEFDVIFNEGYVFDYASGGKKVKASNLEQTITDDSRFRFWLKITVDHMTGGVYSAEIVKKEGETPAGEGAEDPSELKSTISQFMDYSMISPPALISPAYFAIEIAEFNNGELKELYVRENIHFHHKGMQQRSNGEPNSFGVLVPGSSSVSMFNCIRKDPESNNKIRITQDGNDILFYVEGDSGESSV